MSNLSNSMAIDCIPIFFDYIDSVIYLFYWFRKYHGKYRLCLCVVEPHYCFNGGRCTAVSEALDPRGFICLCPYSFFGEFCEKAATQCDDGQYIWYLYIVSDLFDVVKSLCNSLLWKLGSHFIAGNYFDSCFCLAYLFDEFLYLNLQTE